MSSRKVWRLKLSRQAPQLAACVLAVAFTLHFLFPSLPNAPRIGLGLGSHGGPQWVASPPADKGLAQTWLPKPFDRFRWTFVRASVVSPDSVTELPHGATDGVVEVLAFIEETPHLKPSVFSQIWVADLDTRFVNGASCEFDVGGATVTRPASLRFRFPEHRWALLVHCLPPEGLLHSASAKTDGIKVTAILDLEGAQAFRYPMELAVRQPAKPVPLAVCLAPVYGQLNASMLFEWRLHHWLAGVESVHWYDRTNGSDLQDWVERWKQATGAKDTFVRSPPLSPEIYGTDMIKSKGVYADQVLYYMDCQIRTRTTNPADWIAFIDLDEYMLPFPIEAPARAALSTQGKRAVGGAALASASLRSFLASQFDDIGSICIGRMFPSGRPVDLPAGAPEPRAPSRMSLPFLESLIWQRPAHLADDVGNYKCLHRTSAIELASVHYPILHFPRQTGDRRPFTTLWLRGEQPGHSLRIIHRSDKFVVKKTTDVVRSPWPLNEPWTSYLDEMKAHKDLIESSMVWPCPSIPCSA